MSINLENLSPQELAELIARAEQQQKKLRRDRIAEVRKKITAMAKAEGYTIEELFGGARASAARGGRDGKVAPKYRNPADPGQTWSGRGKRPRWFTEALARGMKESDLLI
jgi:DNA-binding protein H-NS